MLGPATGERQRSDPPVATQKTQCAHADPARHAIEAGPTGEADARPRRRHASSPPSSPSRQLRLRQARSSVGSGISTGQTSAQRPFMVRANGRSRNGASPSSAGVSAAPWGRDTARRHRRGRRSGDRRRSGSCRRRSGCSATYRGTRRRSFRAAVVHQDDMHLLWAVGVTCPLRAAVKRGVLGSDSPPVAERTRSRSSAMACDVLGTSFSMPAVTIWTRGGAFVSVRRCPRW